MSGAVQLNTLCDGMEILEEVEIATIGSAYTLSLEATANNQGDLLLIDTPDPVLLKWVHIDGAGYTGVRCLLIAEGEVSIDSTWIRQCKSPPSSSVDGYGAGILVGTDTSPPPVITVSIEDSIIEHNDALAANANGGCIATLGEGTLTVSDSILRNCKSDGKGGLIAIEDDYDASISYSTLYKGETVDEGGGVFIDVGSGKVAEIFNSTISSNKATDALAKGGGISIIGGTLDLLFSTIAGNELPNVNLSIRVGTQLAIESASVDVSGTVLAALGVGGDVCDDTFSATDSLASDSSCGITSGSPNLGSMEFGLGTFYHVPQSGSPLISGASTCPGAGDDQRHETRATSSCWIGSYED